MGKKELPFCLERQANSAYKLCMPHTMKILFLMEDLCFGGTQRQMLELLTRLDRSLFAPHVCTLTGPTDLDAIVHDAHIPLRHFGVTRKVYPFFFLRLGTFLLQERPDLILPCTALPNIWGRIWGKLLGIPVVGTCRGGGGPKRQHEHLLWRLSDHLVCNTLALQQILENMGVPRGGVTCIPNGVNCDFFKPVLPQVAQRPPVILCVARLAQDKDHISLFRAFELVLQAMPEARLHIVGDGPEEVRLKTWVATHNLTEQILFFPGTSDVRKYYAESRVFALSSIREGQPNVILEAMSCGLPVCATAVGGIPALVVHGKTGLLSASGDIHSLADNCLALLQNGENAQMYGMRGREQAETLYTYDAMVKAHEDIFLRIAQRKRG